MRSSFLLVLPFLALAAGCSAGTDDPSADPTTNFDETEADALSGAARSSIAKLALDNRGKGACSRNSKGGHGFDSSCHGNGGSPEYWCADFARWVWGDAGFKTDGLTAAAGSFYMYGRAHHTLHRTPHVGDAVVFNSNGGDYADHVAIVTKVESNGLIETVSGDWGGHGSGEAAFSSTSRVDLNAPAFDSRVGHHPSVIGMKISGYISPVKH